MVDEDLGDALKGLQRNQAIDWKNIGNDFFKKEDYENAIKNYKSAIDIDPSFIDAWNNLGLVYLKIGKIDEAKKCHETIDNLKNTRNFAVKTKPSQQQTQDDSLASSAIRIPTDVSLNEDETPIWSGHMSWASQWALILIGILFIFTFFGIIISIILFVIATLNVETSEFFISNRRVYMKYGWIRRVVNDLKMEWITNVTISQGFMGRILNFGNVIIATPGSHTGVSPFVGVRAPMKVRGLIDAQTQKYRK
jgi:tetratricopeptide (TPR) repeat protein